jgi:hypothetical protein
MYASSEVARLKENYLIQKREKYFLAENKAKLDLRYYLPKEHNTHTYMHQVIIN